MISAQHKALFVTGTGTDVGKTYVCRQLARVLRRHTVVTYLKPVQTGCQSDSQGHLIAPDFEFVRQDLSVVHPDYSVHVPYRFEPACSPHLAAQLAGETIDLEYIVQRFHLLRSSANTVIVEGAGGIYVPLNNFQTTVDLIATLQIPVLLVAAAGLGTLNHTRLSIEALMSHNLTLAGIVVNDTADGSDQYIKADNIETIGKFSPCPVTALDHGCSPGALFEEFCHDLFTSLNG